jgi:hypothetical protein
MSNLSSLIQGEGVQLGDTTFESMTETDMANLLAIAITEACEEDEVEKVVAEEQTGVLLEGVTPDDAPILEVSIVRLDKKAKKQKAYKLAILQCAKDDDNKDYKKLETIWRMEKFLLRKLEKKYAARARSRMKQTANKANGSHPAIKKAKNVLTRSQRETKKALAGDTKPPTQVKSQFNSIAAKLSGKINNQATPAKV